MANNELFDSYGKKCNSRFLLNYGFIEEDNDANEYIFKINFTDWEFPLSEEKIELVPQLIDNVLVFKISRDFESSKFEELMSFIRFSMIENPLDLKALRVRILNEPIVIILGFNKATRHLGQLFIQFELSEQSQREIVLGIFGQIE